MPMMRAPRSLRLTAAAVSLLLGFWLLVPVVAFDDPLSTVVLDRDGELLGASIAADGQWRFGVAPEVPEKFAQAILCFEDRRFYLHPGVDPIALARAALRNLQGGRVVSGGSTLTMQVVRLARKGRPRTLAEKAIEAVLALRLTLSHSKRQVLGLYAAYAPFGGNTVGLDAAAWRYFGREASRLSWAETATLAVLPNAPALVHPGRNRDRLLAKRDRLLDLLRERGAIDAATEALAKREPLPPSPEPLPMLAPHLVARVSAERRERRFRAGDPSPWVVTTLRKSVQLRAVEILARHRRTLAENDVRNAAALVLDAPSGEVLAYVGNQWPPGGDEHGEHVDVIPARRSTGSVLKPLLYASMLEAGEVLPQQLVPDVPTHLGSFHPENFDRAYAGAVPAAQALARSLNVPAVRLLRSHGVERFAAELRRLGLTTLDRPGSEYGLALILGGAEGSLWDVTGVYAGLARAALGRDDSPFFAPSFRPVLPGARRPAASPLGPAASYLTLRAMLEVERPGDDLAWRAFASSRRVAWKTGTSYGFRDAWAIGVTPEHAVGIWVGNASGEGRPGSPATRRPRRSCSISSARSAAERGSASPAKASRTSTSARAAACAPAPTARAGAASSCRGPGSTRRRAPTAGWSTPTRRSRGRFTPTASRSQRSGACRGSCFRRRSRPTSAGSTPTTSRRHPTGPIAAPASARSEDPRCPSCLRARTPSSSSRESSTARAAVWCSRPHTAIRSRASSGTWTTSTRARPSSGTRWRSPRGPGRTGWCWWTSAARASSGISRSWRETAPVLVVFLVGL